MQAIQGTDTLHLPTVRSQPVGGQRVLLDPQGPHWIGTDARGEDLLRLFDGRRSVAQVTQDYARGQGLSPDKAWMHVHHLAQEALRTGFLRRTPHTPSAYEGRGAHLTLQRLPEVWIHTNNSCNLTCTHCLVSSGPDGDKGPAPEVLRNWVQQARALGARRFYFTGGEPFLRSDLPALLASVLEDPAAEACVLTNGMLFSAERLAALKALPAERFRVQVSLDGSCAERNDPTRGAGSFSRIVQGIERAAQAGLHVTVTSVVMAATEDDVPEVTRLAAALGARNHHLLWLHHRGRAAGETGLDLAPERVLEVVRRAREVAAEVGIALDNDAAVERRLSARAGTRHDLSNMGWESLCLYADGRVYPSAALAGDADLVCGDLARESLESIWRRSPVLERLRDVSVKDRPQCRECTLRFLCGGGDLEHAWHASAASGSERSFLADDPYCNLHKGMIQDGLERLIDQRPALRNPAATFDGPRIDRAMGQGAVLCGDREVDAAIEPGVQLRHSECVLSYSLDAARHVVQEFYGAAAQEPQAELCCPTAYDPVDTTHIPQAVLDRFYGCGSPVALCGLVEGETYLDLGSGAGIDVFIAARKVGASGRAIGVDMTEPMLAVAEENRPLVAQNLGFDCAEFRRGYLEDVPLEDSTADCVTSNCVINLSPDKERVLRGIWRVLKSHGRAVLSDIVADREVPPHQQVDGRLWGECLSGALSEEAFLSLLRRVGFHGVEVLRRAPWRQVEDVNYLTMTVRAWKYARSGECVFAGQRATYLGPFEAVVDEEGHRFPRGEAVEVCTDTAARLLHPPYRSSFAVSDSARATAEVTNGCAPGQPCC